MRQLPAAELELVLRCSRADVSAAEAERVAGLLAGPIDWNTLLGFAYRHGLGALLDRAFRTIDSSNVPPDVSAQLRDRCRATRFRSAVLAQELHRVLDALERAGVVATPYKGPALSAFLYQDIGLRESGDIDILVRSEDALRAYSVLAQGGFAPHQTPFGQFSRLHAGLHCSFSFTAPASKALVEMNWRPAPWYWRMPGISEAAWDGLGTLVVSGRPVRWFAAEHVLLALCVHGCKHKWELVKWIADVADLLRTQSQLDIRRTIQVACEIRAERMLRLGLFLAWDLLDAPLPSDIVDSIRQDGRTSRRAEEVYAGILALSQHPIELFEQLRFVASVADRYDTKACCRALVPAYFLLHRVVRPGAAGLRQLWQSGDLKA